MARLNLHHFRSVFFNTTSQLSAKFISSATTLLVTVLISYFLGLSEYGSLSKILTFVSLFYLLADFGMNAHFLKEHYDNPESQLANLLYTRLGFSLVLTAVCIIAAFLLPFNAILYTGYSPLEKAGMVIFSFTIISFGLTTSLQALIQKKLKYSLLIIPNIISAVVLLIGVGWGIWLNSLPVIIFSFVVSGCAMTGSLWVMLNRAFPFSAHAKHTWPFAKQLLKHSWPLGMVLLFNLLYVKADAILLAFYKPAFDVGVYGFAYRIFEFLITIPAFVSNSLYPILLATQNDSKTFKHLINRYALLLLGGSIIISCVVIIAAPLLSFIKSDYSYVTAPLRILALSLPFFFVTGLLQWIFIIHGKRLHLFWLYFGCLIINIGLNLVLIPRMSYNGAAFTTLISEGLVLCIMIVMLAHMKLLKDATPMYE